MRSVEFLREEWLHLLPTISLLDDSNCLNSPSHQQYYYGKWERCLPTNPRPPIMSCESGLNRWVILSLSPQSMASLSSLAGSLSSLYMSFFFRRLILCPCTPGTPLEGARVPASPTSTPNLHLHTCILLVNVGWTYLNHLRQNRHKVQTFGLFGPCWGERFFHWCCQIPIGRQTHGVSKSMLSSFSFVRLYFDSLSVSAIMHSLKLLL